MTLVDASVWIDFFNGAEGREVEWLVNSIRQSAKIVVGDLTLVEVLQGFRSDRDFEKARSLLADFPNLRILDDQCGLLAAQYYRQLRNRGVTVRNTIDTLIATRCIIDDMPLLFRDRDFDPFVQHCGLVSAMDG